MEINGRKVATHPNADGYVAIQRQWKKGDRITLRLKLEPRLIIGDHSNQGKVALMYGPLVLAADEALLGKTSPANKPGLRLPRSKPFRSMASPWPVRNWPSSR